MEKEVIDATELRQLLEEHDPGPKLVPGSVAVEKTPPADGEPKVEERPLRVEERL